MSTLYSLRCLFIGITNVQGPPGRSGPVGDRGYRGDRGQAGYAVGSIVSIGDTHNLFAAGHSWFTRTERRER